MSTSLVVPSVTTGFKFAGTTLAAIFVKANQAFNSVSDANIEKVFSDASTVLKKEIMDVKGTCTGQYAVTNVSEENILKKLICKIIDNDNKGQPSLSDESLDTLSSIINGYSNKKYVSMSKKLYENEKSAASDAIRNGIIGTQLVNTGVDIGVAAVKSSIPSNKFVKDYLTTPPPQPQSPLDSATSVLGKSVAPAAATLASFFIGKKIFQKFNTVIPKKYIPNFNLLVTALTERQKMKNEANIRFTSCKKDIMNQFYKQIKDYFQSNPSSDIFNFSYNPQDATDRVNIKRKDFDFIKGVLKKGTRPSPAVSVLDGVAFGQCNLVYNAEIAEIDSDIKNIEGISKQFLILFDTTGSDLTELKQATEELVPILSNIELKNTNVSDLRETIRLKITEFKQEQQQRQQQGQSIGDRMTNWLLPPGGGGRTVNRRKEKRRKTTRRR
jgi:hypothetical protein